MGKFMFIQICTQAELSIHMNQQDFNDRASESVFSGNRSPSRSPIRSKRITNRNSPRNSKVANSLRKSPLKNSRTAQPMFETQNDGLPQPSARAREAAFSSFSKHRSENTVLTLDKDVNELQLTYDMFKD